MKKFLLALVVIATTFFSCSDDDFGGGNAMQGVGFSVNLSYQENQAPVNGAVVTLTNTNTGDVYTSTSAASGVALFATVLPGQYTVTATKTLSAADYQTIFGYTPQSQEVVFNGSQENVTVNANVSSTSISLKAARMGDLVIKQIYYAGSHTTQGASFRDQFIEIYNNSNEVIYADGLYIAQLYGKINKTVNEYTQADGQFDWSKSLGMNPLLGNRANTDYVYADYVIQVPGNGSQYPIQPGASIVIAQNAQNHTGPIVDASGEPINIINPALTIDLSSADFEVYLGDFRLSIGETIYNTDIQNPAVPDMNIAYWGRPGYYSGNKDFLLDNPGRDSFAIFRSEDFTTYADYPDPSVSEIVNNTKFFLQIPVSVIIDGVDLQNFNQNSQRPKMLPSHVDATFTNCDASFNSQSVMRKVKTTINGRKVLEDTNSSANDFVKMSKADPRGFAQ